MRAIEVLISAIHLVFMMLILSVGSFFVMLYYKPQFIEFFINYMLENPEIVLKIGLFTLAAAFILFISFYQLHKKQYLKVLMKKNKTDVDTKLIRNYIEKYFESIYPDKKNRFQVNVDVKDKLEIIARIDSLDDKKEFLLNIEEKIGKLLLEHLDYDKEFIFTLKEK
ncbi:MAG: hypothetical protein KR126chlam4_01151 [Candidatus Anoxychlamydiales bacterium]|nr:hypothetical protein [Candidatus Anoxychlamydiales bacterium]